MIIQRMKFRIYGKIRKYNCGVNKMHHGGEFTFCGCAIPDSSMKLHPASPFGMQADNFEKIGEEYTGTLKDLTCPECKKYIAYVKGLQ